MACNKPFSHQQTFRLWRGLLCKSRRHSRIFKHTNNLLFSRAFSLLRGGSATTSFLLGILETLNPQGYQITLLISVLPSSSLSIKRRVPYFPATNSGFPLSKFGRAVAVQAFNPSARQAEAGGRLGLQSEIQHSQSYTKNKTKTKNKQNLSVSKNKKQNSFSAFPDRQARSLSSQCDLNLTRSAHAPFALEMIV